jgi:hypothetical protein
MAVIAKNQFRFSTSSNLMELTGKRARHLKEFVEILKEIDGSSIFCHTHQAFREFNFAKGIFTNDFAYWAANAIQEEDLAERLASIDIRDFVDIRSLRERLVEIIEAYLGEKDEIRIAPRGKEFRFCKSISVVTLTPYEAWTLSDLKEALKRVGARSIFYHFFDARLRLGRPTNDFSNWIESSLEKPELAKKIEKLDPYLFTLDGLRQKIIELIEEEEKMDTIDGILKDKTLSTISKLSGLFAAVKTAKKGERLRAVKDALDKMIGKEEKK